MMQSECKADRHFASPHQSDNLCCTVQRAAARFRNDDERPSSKDRCCENLSMSIYRQVKRASPDNVHDFSLQRSDARKRESVLSSEWLAKRKAQPCETLLATTARWYASLPTDAQPQVLCATFPRILNCLAAGWNDRDRTLRYFDDLLTDRRGGRKGFPADVLEELHRLKTFYEALNPAANDIWRSAD
jgi:hypothetical protein